MLLLLLAATPALRLPPPVMNAAQDAAKAAWLAKLDANTWGAVAAAVTTEVVIADLEAECDSGETEACDDLSVEEAGKAAWLATLDKPTLGAVEQAVDAVATSECGIL